MICCEQASHSTNLNYSALKFLCYEDFVWSGSFLPLRLEPLGELHSIQVRLSTCDGQKQDGAYWERGMLFHEFKAGLHYKLEMRLEYSLPLTTNVFSSDFYSIHPRSYTAALDFAFANLPGNANSIQLNLGETQHVFALDQPFERQLEEGHSVRLCLSDDMGSLIVRHSADAPFCHRSFPQFCLDPTTVPLSSL